MEKVIGVIGGSGLYEIDGLKVIERREVETPFGKPSDALIIAELEGLKVVFLARHGQGHYYAPNEVNYRANIYALKEVGVTDILSVSACGSLREHLSPGMFCLVDQFIDRTTTRANSFFGTGLVAHVSMAHPTCPRLAQKIAKLLQLEDIPFQMGGTYLAIEGPQFSTYAESNMYRAWGADVIGMTNMPEARLAREAEICYQTIAMVTDFDCWHSEHGHVDVQAVLKVLATNSHKAKQLIKSLAKSFALTREPCSEACDIALDLALVTSPDRIDPEMKVKLEAILKRRLLL